MTLHAGAFGSAICFFHQLARYQAGWDPFLANLTARINEADALVAGATGKTSDKTTSTRSEETLKKNLLKIIQVIQTRAKRKYKDTTDPARDKYFIGERLGSNRPLLERASRSIATT